MGDPDENMFIVESGCVKVYYEVSGAGIGDASSDFPGKSDKAIELKEVHSGEPIGSLLSFIDHLAGRRKCYKTVWARASQETKVIKCSFESFKQAFEKKPSQFVQSGAGTKLIKILLFYAISQWAGFVVKLYYIIKTF